jgi:hypothetical protein
MDPSNDYLALRVEKIRLAWSYLLEEAQAHRQLYMQLFAGSLGVGLAAFVSLAFERVPMNGGIAVLAATATLGAYSHVRLRKMRRNLRRSLDVATETIDGLMREVRP